MGSGSSQPVGRLPLVDAIRLVLEIRDSAPPDPLNPRTPDPPPGMYLV